MRFSDFFISYKIGLKEIKNTIPFTELPLYRKIALITTYAIIIIIGILLILKFNIAALIVSSIGVTLLIAFVIIDSRKKILNLCLTNTTHHILNKE